MPIVGSTYSGYVLAAFCEAAVSADRTSAFVLDRAAAVRACPAQHVDVFSGGGAVAVGAGAFFDVSFNRL